MVKNANGLNRFQQHIVDLCKEYKIEYKIRPGRAAANVGKHKIYIPGVYSIKTYFITLHEIGHLAVGLNETVLERERLAWDWAMQKSLVRANQDMRQVICALLVRHMYEAPEEKPTEEYIKLVKWWEKI